MYYGLDVQMQGTVLVYVKQKDHQPDLFWRLLSFLFDDLQCLIMIRWSHIYIYIYIYIYMRIHSAIWSGPRVIFNQCCVYFGCYLFKFSVTENWPFLGPDVLLLRWPSVYYYDMMTSSNGNIFRVTGPLRGEFTGPGDFPAQRPVTRSFDCIYCLHPGRILAIG